jgi:hypothetical protein
LTCAAAERMVVEVPVAEFVFVFLLETVFEVEVTGAVIMQL